MKIPFFVLLFVSTIFSFNTFVHLIIGNFAQSILNRNNLSYKIDPKLNKLLDELFPNSTFVSEKTLDLLDGLTLGEVSGWPDYFQTYCPNGQWSENMHFNQVDKSASNFNMNYCSNKNDFCLVHSIYNMTSRVLKDISLDGKRNNENFRCSLYRTLNCGEPCALSFLIHFMGDIHQPLRCGYKEDQGGLLVPAKYFNKTTNLHELWEKYLPTNLFDGLNFVQINELLFKEMAAIPAGLIIQYGYDHKELDAFKICSNMFQYVKNFVYCNGCYNNTEFYIQYTKPIIKKNLIFAALRFTSLYYKLFF